MTTVLAREERERELRADKERRVQQALLDSLTEGRDELSSLQAQFGALAVSGYDERSIIQRSEDRLDLFRNDDIVRSTDKGAFIDEIDELLYEILQDVIVDVILTVEKRLPLIEKERKTAIYLTSECPDQTLIADAFNIELHAKHLRCLKPREWLNDEVINMFLQLLQKRSDQRKAKKLNRPHSYFFNTFFMPKLFDGGKYVHKNVARWTRKVDLFSYDRVFVPVHVHGNHWCLGMADIKNKRISYFDSLGGQNPDFCDGMKRYLADEFKSKHPNKPTPDISSWPSSAIKCSRQDNGSDCGVFTLKFADALSDGVAPEAIKATDMPYYRQRIALELKYQKIV